MLGFLAGIILTLLYAFLMQSFPKGTTEPWVVIACINSFLALAILLFSKTKIKLDEPRRPIVKIAAYSLAPLVVMASAVIALLSKTKPPGQPYSTLEILGLVVWVPILEEVIFRRGVYSWLSQRFPKFWSLYLSALIFALAHVSLPYIIPPLGPFLLGFVASWVYRVTGHLVASIALHAACNASAILFTLYAPEWIDHLNWLYQRL